jgi:hypothetical protein
LWDTGSSNCIASPATARRWGYHVPDKPTGHGTMVVADGSTTGIYGWTGSIRVRPPTHLIPSDNSARVTALQPMVCLVADISEDLIVGFDYIEPMRGGFDRVGSQRCFRLAVTTADGSPTVMIPLIGAPSPSDTHYALDDGYAGTTVQAFSNKISAAAGHPTGPSSPRASTFSAKKQRAQAAKRFQYKCDHPHMVTQVDMRVQGHMCPDADLFPDQTPLHQAPLAAPPAV